MAGGARRIFATAAWLVCAAAICDPRAKDWIIILSTGRSGSSTALGMVRTLPGVELEGEHFGQLRDLQAFRDHGVKTDKMHGPAFVHNTRFDDADFVCWVQNWYSRSSGAADGIRGFKEIRYNDVHMIQFLAHVFPTAKFVLTYQRDVAGQAVRASRLRHGFEKFSASKIGAETKVLRDLHAKRPNTTFALALEDISPAKYDALFAFLGFPHCKTNFVLRHNGYSGFSRDKRPEDAAVTCNGTSRKRRTDRVMGADRAARRRKQRPKLQKPQVARRTDAARPG
ncbi:hypothetical protein M885DRAFT_549197 [Pelagophyceae sp. CCMP2097]|nr:hypothetical protein M885DRAFT_549197 [Pelagophyceae sp. CCMP2097]|mmetsp:Transcript_33106/g.113898  ORF Transcript_33106/g.113898 Transcript_33106/m.113898 type:complete len:283 (-) Transcript_33106:28-876(-)